MPITDVALFIFIELNMIMLLYSLINNLMCEGNSVYTLLFVAKFKLILNVIFVGWNIHLNTQIIRLAECAQGLSKFWEFKM